MQLDKINQLIRKIEALAANMEDQGQTSALERDLMLRYVRDMYELIAAPVDTVQVETQDWEEAVAPPAPQVQKAPEPTVQSVPEPVRPAAPEATEETVTVPNATVENVKNEVVEKEEAPAAPVERAVPNIDEMVNETATASSMDAPASDAVENPTMHEFTDSTKYFPPEQQAPTAEPSPVSVEEVQAVPSNNGRFNALFEAKAPSDLMASLQNASITSVDQALGLNQRLLTINALFAGDAQRFNETVSALNGMNSFDEARNYLVSGVAADFSWDADERVNQATEFIALVRRKFN